MRNLISNLLDKFMNVFFKKISIDDPIMDEVIDGRITRRAIVLALIEGRQK